jgi:UDP-N-acetylenolpyruvoylglucosamine reductase
VGPGATQAQIVNQMRRIRNKNPNCNHNSGTVFHQPHYNNVKYDDSQPKKDDVLKKHFFRESSKLEDQRGSQLGAAGQLIIQHRSLKTDMN